MNSEPGELPGLSRIAIAQIAIVTPMATFFCAP